MPATRFLRARSFALIFTACLSVAGFAAQPKLVIQDEDRVLLIGDVLIERENNYGYLEAKMRREFAGKKFSVRNLGYSGDSPLGASRASFDPVAKGVDSLKEQLEVVKPTVAILGYGMAASLDSLTYSKNDPTLNPDPARYGNDHSPEKFKNDLVQLMELITQSSPNGKVRFVFLGPVKHEDLRASRPGLPDPSEHNAVLTAFEKAMSDLAAEKQVPFIRADWKQSAGIALEQATDNGIHLTAQGYRALAEGVAAQLGWKVDAQNWDKESESQLALREAILRKNSLFFHRSRPANYTYIFGFRKREQGQNAVEIPKFDPLIEKAEANVIGISAGKPSALPKVPKTSPKLATLPSLPRPDFTLGEGLEMTLFAENPLLEKPVHMNWDTAGKLWLATSNTYPQVNPEDLGAQMKDEPAEFGPSTGNDKIILLEDTNHDGVADSSRIVADQLLIPAGVAPDNKGGCFVGASTELLHLTKPGSDGLMSERRIVLSGFGTEDTHHIIHSLHWGIDGRLYFHQTIYIHSHLETPWGLVRANSGVAFAYDPSTERLEVHSKGLVNAWGQQEDVNGQTFLTSGADGNGVSWSFPGAVLPPSEGARRFISSISPGSYPKFCGLELLNSPLFAPDWQGNAITCDFRAHRIVRFAFNDFTAEEKPKSGYVTKVMPDIVRTSDASFRPIGLSMGPDGGLYVADWSNPIINHGEVDFRDPRRDKQRGRIWRIAPAGSKPLKWESPAGNSTEALLAKLVSPNRWEFEQARRELAKVPVADLQKALAEWAKDEVTRRHAAWLLSGRTADTAHLSTLLNSSDPVSVQVGLREIGKSYGARGVTDLKAIAPLLKHSNPRVRLEAYRTLARIPTAESADLVLKNRPSDPEDSFLDFAAWTSLNELARPWLEDLATHPAKVADNEASLALLAKTVDPVVSTPFIQRLFKGRSIDKAGSGPWIELLGQAGGVGELTHLYQTLIKEGALSKEASLRVANALVDAARARNLRPEGDLSAVGSFLNSGERAVKISAINLVGEWKLVRFVPQLAEFAGSEKDGQLRGEAFKALRSIGQQPTVDALRTLLAETKFPAVRRGALVPLSVHAPGDAVKALPAILGEAGSPDVTKQIWKDMFQNAGFAGRLAKEFPKGLAPEAYAAALETARGMGRGGQALVAAISPLAGATNAPRNYAAEVAAITNQIKLGADPADGELVYRKNGCALCHAIGGAGGKLGPDLSSIGASAPLDYIIESVLNPAAKVKEGYHAFAFTMKDGTVENGIPAGETATEIIIRPGPGFEKPLIKANILKRENIGSIMPAGLADGLEGVPRRNLFAFLGEIGRPGPFDASKGNVARLWWFYADQGSALSKDAAVQRASMPTYTLVNGQLANEFFLGRTFATAKFTAAAPTAKPLVLTGVKAAWLDGTSVPLKDGQLTASIPAGNHSLTVEIDPSTRFLRAQCDDVSFLGD